MSLEIQIQSICLSVFYGMFSALTFNLFYSIMFKSKLVIRIILMALYSFLLFSLYFLLLVAINEGIIHVYFCFAFLVGFLISNRKTKILRSKFNPYSK